MSIVFMMAWNRPAQTGRCTWLGAAKQPVQGFHKGFRLPTALHLP